jgi:hypothetical protein
MAVRLAAKRPLVKQHYATATALKWQNADYRKNVGNNISAFYATEHGFKIHSNASKLVANRPEVKLRLSMIMKFRNKYGTSSIYKYLYDNDLVRPYMHFIIVDGIAIVFIWDSRQIVYRVHVSDLANDYVKCCRHDSYGLLLDNALNS